MGAWLSFIFALIFLFISSYKSLEKRRSILVISAILIIPVLTFIIVNRWERLMDLGNPQNSITERLNYWRTAIAIIKDHPIIGVGPGNFQEVFLKYKMGLSTNTRYAHNIFLHFWSEIGLLGLMGIFYLVINFFRRCKAQPKYRFIFLGGLTFILHNLIDNSYFIPEAGMFWWILLGLTLED
ncbi:O-antigen ligase family protein [Candidatus Omnitrophota bacterium]